MRPRHLAASALAALALAAAPGRAGGPPARPAVVVEPLTGMELVLVEGGCFQMGDLFGDGDEEESPVHEACVGDLYVGRYEVTRGEWRRVMGTSPSRDAGCDGGDACPVDSVSWEEARAFLARLGGAGGGGYRLPTEAEWEYAARSGGRAERYAGGNDVEAVAWYSANAGRRTHAVGRKAPNGLGLFDMSGNVWEWTADWYGHASYAASPRVDPRGPAGSAGPTVDHVIRGGCKTGEASNARTARRSYGYQRTGADRGDKLGFRAVRAP